MPSTCEFVLNNPNGVYYSGQIVSGSITLKTTSEKNVRNVRIRFLGEAKVHWQEQESYRNHEGKSRSRTIHYRGNEVYIENTTIVHGEGILQPGTHNYTFNIVLPVTCPTSCEGRYGKIRYELWLIIDRPFRFDNEFSQPLTVLRTVDLNLNPAFRIPIQTEDVSSIGCWPCASGKILYNLTIPLGAYAPGQSLRYTLHIQNQSMTDIKGYKAEFVESMTFTAQTPHRKSREKNSVLACVEYDDICLRQMNRVFEGEIQLPSMPPTTEGFSIIRVEYYLELEMRVDGCCYRNNSIDASVFIGNVPLREFMPQMQGPPIIGMPQMPGPPIMGMPQPDIQFTEVGPTAPLMPPPPHMNVTNGNDAPPTYLDTQPPSFEQAVRSESPFVDPDANEHNKVIGFRPMYPMYPSAPEKK